MGLTEAQKEKIESVRVKLKSSFRSVFGSQINRWFCMNCFHQIVVTLILVQANLLKYGGPDYEFFKCSPDGGWTPVSQWADVFGTLHVMIVLIEALQCERIFFSIPHKLGYFKKDGTLNRERDDSRRPAGFENLRNGTKPELEKLI